ncbi:amidohydrolase family protein [Dehalobacterium formicoaceticum]|uniref:Amidohydrolase n=1 Tax=Dehalobacterium formicoaceticum TaxID=51515 RepID=A0ABT1Y203_9FIRM|nr:amidohydrolase family protein [Dehalobacterium formicoaceticum]MCR6544894.1 amidohydrolase [Dehalobacterium formicoaceticum]
MAGKTFYDVHCHVMNLSHPNFLAFLRRFEPTLLDHPIKIFFGANLAMLSYLVFHTFSPRTLTRILNTMGVTDLLNRVKNLLVIMEHDAASVFQMLDREMHQELLEGSRLSLGNFHYDKIVLTPLMMDFGYKNMTNPAIYYNAIPVQKPIVEQVLDLFNGIRTYYQGKETKERFFQVYPFLGINTSNYTMEKVEKMLDKYFGEYSGNPLELEANQGKFNGDIDSMGSNFFSGIKVYPPLGFDPWPEDPEERKKSECLYEFSSCKRIPITTHCSNGGYRIIDTKDAELYSSPARWALVLKNFPELKLNFGHLGNQEGKGKNKWAQDIFSLIDQYEHVYTDFSCRGFDDQYYRSLRKMIAQGDSGLKKRLAERILFGSDFSINLLWMNSYSNYLKIFRDTPYFSQQEKDVFCSQNPESFLFS